MRFHICLWGPLFDVVSWTFSVLPHFPISPSLLVVLSFICVSLIHHLIYSNNTQLIILCTKTFSLSLSFFFLNQAPVSNLWLNVLHVWIHGSLCMRYHQHVCWQTIFIIYSILKWKIKRMLGNIHFSHRLPATWLLGLWIILTIGNDVLCW